MKLFFMKIFCNFVFYHDDLNCPNILGQSKLKMDSDGFFFQLQTSPDDGSKVFGVDKEEVVLGRKNNSSKDDPSFLAIVTQRKVFLKMCSNFLLSQRKRVFRGIMRK